MTKLGDVLSAEKSCHAQRDSPRKACLDNVANVRGKNRRICKTVESLPLMSVTKLYCTLRYAHFAVLEAVFQIIPGADILDPAPGGASESKGQKARLA